MGAKPAVDTLAARFRALAHPIRIELLDALGSGPQSPSGFSATTGHDLSKTAHHFRVLRGADLIEVQATEQRRGAIMSIYRLTGPGQRILDSVKRLQANRDSAAKP